MPDTTDPLDAAITADPTAEIARLRSEVEHLTRERDAARADAAKLREALRGVVAEAMSERDMDALFDYLIDSICQRADELGITPE